MHQQTIKFGCRCLLTLLAVMLDPAGAFAGSSPELNSVMPRGVQRGREHTLHLKGVRLTGAEEVFFYGKGITTKSVKVIDHKKLEVVVNVEADCRLGEHVLQVRCDKGVSDFRTIFVGPYPAVAEKEPNNDFATAKKIKLNQTAVGQIRAEDQDYFVVSLKAGTRMSVEVEAMRLGTFFDSKIFVFDANKKEVAVCDDTELFNQDGFVTVTAPADGDYFVMIRDAAFASVNNANYRLHIGDYDRPRAMFPSGGNKGVKLMTEMFAPLALEGWRVAAGKSVEISLPGDPRAQEVFGDGPSALPLRVVSFQNFVRADDAENFNFKTALEVATPIAINARITRPEQRHFYSFHAKKNKKLSIDVFAKRIGSPLDPIVNVFDAKRKSLIGSDDAKDRPDSFLVFNPPADGVYSLRLMDYFGRGDDDMIYRVEITPVDPLLTLNIKRNGRFSQTRMAMAVPQGGRFAAIVSAKKEHFTSDVELQFEGLPEGVSVTSKLLKKNANELPVVFEATEDCEFDLSLVTVSAKAANANTKAETKADSELAPTFTTKFTATSLDSRGPPNNSSYHPTVVDKLAVGVVDPLPFSIAVEPLKAPLVREGSARVKVVAHRDEGFKEKILLQFPYRSPGIGTFFQIVMKADQTEIEYPINANKGAQLGEWPFYVIASANVQGPAWTSSKLETLSVEEPFVALESKRTVCTRNASVKLVCEIEQLREFTGEATAELKGLPPHMTIAEPQKFDKATKEITFVLKTNDKTPFGQHKSIFVEVSVPVGDGRSVARAGTIVLQVNRPLNSKPKVVMGGAVQ